MQQRAKPLASSPPIPALQNPLSLASDFPLPLSSTHLYCPAPPLALQFPAETEQERQLKEEADIMRQVTQKQALKTYKELAKDISYSRSINTGWKPPLRYRLMSDEEHQVGAGCGWDAGVWVGAGQMGRRAGACRQAGLHAGSVDLRCCAASLPPS